MRIQIVDVDDFVIDSIGLDHYDLTDPDDIQRLVDLILEIINNVDEM